MMITKNVAQKNSTKTVKKKVVIPKQMGQQSFNEFKRKKKMGIKNKDQWPIGTTVIEDDSILKAIVGKTLCRRGCLVKVKSLLGSTADDLSI